MIGLLAQAQSEKRTAALPLPLRRVSLAQHQPLTFIRDFLGDGAKPGNLRDDIAPAELASYCIHTMTAAGGLPSKAALRRFVTVVLAGLRPAR